MTFHGSQLSMKEFVTRKARTHLQVRRNMKGQKLVELSCSTKMVIPETHQLVSSFYLPLYFLGRGGQLTSSLAYTALQKIKTIQNNATKQEPKSTFHSLC
jgi:hypothetical protein